MVVDLAKLSSVEKRELLGLLERRQVTRNRQTSQIVGGISDINTPVPPQPAEATAVGIQGDILEAGGTRLQNVPEPPEPTVTPGILDFLGETERALTEHIQKNVDPDFDPIGAFQPREATPDIFSAAGARNLTRGISQLPLIPVGILEGLVTNPAETVKELFAFFPEQADAVAAASGVDLLKAIKATFPLSPEDEELRDDLFVSEEEQAQAQAQIAEAPEAPLLAAAGVRGLFKSFASKLTDALPSRKALVRATDKPTLELAKAGETALEFGIKFDGVAPVAGKQGVFSFTDNVTGAKIVVDKLTDTGKRLAEKRAEFVDPQKTSGTKPIKPEAKGGESLEIEFGNADVVEQFSGVAPDFLFDKVRQAAGKKFGFAGEEGGRTLVNVIGTPEVVLRGRGIVEPFREAKSRINVDRENFREDLNLLFEGIEKDSPADVALFKKLDNPDAVLETGIGQAARVYLDNLLENINVHRVTRGEKPIQRRAGYITHLTDYAKEQSSLFNDLPLPKSMQFRFTERKGETAFKTSAIEAINVYTEAALRDIHLGDALSTVIPKIEQLKAGGGKDAPILVKRKTTLPNGKELEQSYYNFNTGTFGSERAYAEAFVKRQLGWPTTFQRAVSNAFGVSPLAQAKTSQLVTAMYYRSLIGMALDTGVKNLTQMVNTMAEFGVMPSMRGLGKTLTPRGIGVTKRQHLLDDFVPLLHGGEALKASGQLAEVAKAFDKFVITSPMRTAEFVNRGMTYHTALDHFIKKGHSIEVADVMAKESVRKLQFAYSSIDVSPYLQGPVARPGFQFFSFPLKQSELMFQWAKENPGRVGKLMRYMAFTGALVLGGKYGDIDFSNIFFDPLKMVDPDSDKGVGLPFSDKRVEFSLEKLAGSGFAPQGPAPVVSHPIGFIESQLSDDRFTRERGLIKGFELIIPGGRYGRKVMDAMDAGFGFDVSPTFVEGARTGRRGRKTSDVTPFDIALRLGGLRSNQNEIEFGRRNDVKDVEDYYYQSRQDFIDAIIDGDKESAKDIFSDLKERYPFLLDRFFESVTADAVKGEAVKKEQTTEERFFDSDLRKEILIGIRNQNQEDQ